MSTKTTNSKKTTNTKTKKNTIMNQADYNINFTNFSYQSQYLNLLNEVEKNNDLFYPILDEISNIQNIINSNSNSNNNEILQINYNLYYSFISTLLKLGFKNNINIKENDVYKIILFNTKMYTNKNNVNLNYSLIIG